MIWSLILNSRPVRWLAGALAALAGLWAYGAAKKREGAVAARNDAAAKAAKADQQAHERINNADTGAGASDDERVRRLREFAAKHGNRPPKAGGR